MANRRAQLATLLTLCCIAAHGCARKPVSQTRSESAPLSTAASAATAITTIARADLVQVRPQTETEGTRLPSAALAWAIRTHEYALAEHDLERRLQNKGDATRALVRGYLALQNARPEQALAQLSGLKLTPKPLDAWTRELEAEALSRTANYRAHLRALTEGAPFERLHRVAERLIADKELATGEGLLAKADSRARSVDERGQVRWLRARLRLAQGRAGAAATDIRWLVVTHPEHPLSETAFDAVLRGDFPALTVGELQARVNTAAERGLVDVVEQSLANGNPLRLTSARSAYLRGLALYRARRFEQAVPHLDQAVAERVAQRDQARNLAALASSRAGLVTQALQRLTEVASSKPVTPSVVNATFLLGREQAWLGNWERASEHYTHFLTTFPDHALEQDAHRERLLAWFGAENYRRFVYWVRRFHQKYPNAKEGSLLRSLEALALFRLGHTDLARDAWQQLVRSSPLSFVGLVARRRLEELGTPAPLVLNVESATDPTLELPGVVAELEAVGLSELAEKTLIALESQVVKATAPHDDHALCEAYGRLERGRRRYEIGRALTVRFAIQDAPELVPSWVWHCLYPTPYSTSVAAHANTHRVSPNLIYAVMRQESAFQEQARSPAGARGLMQIIEPTARKIAADLGRVYDPEHLEVAHHNIEYGSFYLGKLQSYFGHVVLVAAAYNAGPDAVARWFAVGKTLPVEAFVARIPYAETRSYVQRVVENLEVYQRLGSAQAPALKLEFEPLAPQGELPGELVHRAPEGFY